MIKDLQLNKLGLEKAEEPETKLPNIHWITEKPTEVGGRFRMGNTCTPMADACWCMAKPIQYCKVKKKKKKSRDISLQTSMCIVKAVFSSSHVRMWELDRQDPKNWMSAKELMPSNCAGFISALIFKIYFLLLTLGFFISSFSSCFGVELGYLLDFSYFLR